jgi:hypothetical protein
MDFSAGLTGGRRQMCLLPTPLKLPVLEDMMKSAFRKSAHTRAIGSTSNMTAWVSQGVRIDGIPLTNVQAHRLVKTAMEQIDPSFKKEIEAAFFCGRQEEMPSQGALKQMKEAVDRITSTPLEWGSILAR